MRTDPVPLPDDLVADAGTGWILWEVFVRTRGGLAHTHVGSVLATDQHMALRYGRELFSRRGEPMNIWVLPSASITASEPDEGELSNEVPDGVQQA